MQTLYNRYHAYNDLGRKISEFADRKADEILQFVKDLENGEEIHFAEVEVICLQAISVAFAEARLKHGLKLRKEEKKSGRVSI
jgi:hypothetical protein